MATERKVWEIIKSAGFEPVTDRGIIVKYAPENPGDKTAQFSAWNFMYFHVGSPGLRCFQSSGFPPLYKQKDTAAAS